ncbi:MAG: molybdopterin-dependent oxidoreductase [Actinomycetota bacterium]|nr:molybdopterin-dependent oxidoreductase [Actinomycetota bacterium]
MTEQEAGPSRETDPNEPSTSGKSARVAGALATAVVLATLWGVSGWVTAVGFLPTEVATKVIRSVPGDLATFFIETLGHLARPLLVAGVLAGAILLGAETLARTTRNGRLRPFLAGAVVALIGWLALLPTSSGGFATREGLLATLALVVAVPLYARVAETVAAGPKATHTFDPGRRRTLGLGAGSALALALAGGVAGYFGRKLGGPNRTIALVEPLVPAPLPERPGFPKIPGLTPEITTTGKHYVVDINLVQPSVEAAGWNLELTGEVESPLNLSFSQLGEGFEVVEEYSVLTCISNEVGGDLIGSSLWGGVRLRDLLDAAGPHPGALDVVFRAADGYSDSITLETARSPSVLLAFAQNRRPLTQEHGFPCRVRVPSTYGMKNVKWIEAIEVVARDYKGYWMERGWSDLALVRTQSRIDVAGDSGSAVVGEATWVAGVAWAGDRGVKGVEVSTDGGSSWQDALVKEPIGPLTWRQWAYRWTPEEAGTTSVVCRATDGLGDVQTKETAAPHPAGATGYPTLEVTVA